VVAIVLLERPALEVLLLELELEAIGALSKSEAAFDSLSSGFSDGLAESALGSGLAVLAGFLLPELLALAGSWSLQTDSSESILGSLGALSAPMPSCIWA
jgi:hypothetical protein